MKFCIDMAKVQIKSEKLTPFGEIFYWIIVMRYHSKFQMCPNKLTFFLYCLRFVLNLQLLKGCSNNSPQK